MNKEFVPYEEALALKMLGFDEPCLATYQEGLRGPIMWDYWSIELKNSTNEEDEVLCTTPTFSQAFRWFREKHNLFAESSRVEVKLHSSVYYHRFVIKGEDNTFKSKDIIECNSYEEAELACLKKLIEIVKNK